MPWEREVWWESYVKVRCEQIPDTISDMSGFLEKTKINQIRGE